MDSILYSQSLEDIFYTYIVEGICKKRRFGNPKLITKDEIEKERKNFENIVIQESGIVKIYCSKFKFKQFNEFLSVNIYAYSKYKQGLIEIYSN